HRRFGPRAGEANSFQAWNRLAQQLGEVGVQFVLVGAGGAAFQHGFDGSADARISVPQHGGSVTATQVNVFATVAVPNAAAEGAAEEERMAERAIETG